jgi:aminoglycoside/choline kinase family phosphotransferase
VRDGKPYSAIVHLAEDVKPFVAVANGLGQFGFSSPQIFEADLEEGLLIIEDFGGEFVVDGDPPEPVEERYAAAVDMLIALHCQNLPEVLPVEPHVQYKLPRYDLEAMLMETELLLDWYLPSLGAKLSEATRTVYVAMWREALQTVIETDITWVMRDFHSPNLMWLPDREGVAKVGLLDFQDAVLGPAAYDLASLLQDARVDVPEMMEVSLLGRYVQKRREAHPDFDPAAFIQAYATMAAQRASKILGIFARLDGRDNKPQYLRHIPRVWAYLQRSLTHPSLATLHGWYSVHVPKLGG